MSPQPLTLSIIIPVYNEQETLIPLLDKVKSVELFGMKKEIIIVNDGWVDRTPEILKKIELTNGKILHHEQNRGKGAAIRTAIPHTHGEFVIIQDADLEYDPKDYEKVLEPLIKGEADVAYGSRFLGLHRAFYSGTWWATNS